MESMGFVYSEYLTKKMREWIQSPFFEQRYRKKDVDLLVAFTDKYIKSECESAKRRKLEEKKAVNKEEAAEKKEEKDADEKKEEKDDTDEKKEEMMDRMRRRRKVM